MDVERARMLRETGGSVLLRLASGSAEHRVLVSIGGSTPKHDAPDCEIECALTDLFAIQSGTANPFQLLLDGKIRIKGNAELALAVGAALG
jgi:putative sterol carrier protein